MSARRAAVLITALAALVIAGCGDGNGSRAITTTAETSIAPPTEPVGNPLDGGYPALEEPVKGGVLRAALGHDLDCWTGLSGDPTSASIFAFTARGLYGTPATVQPPMTDLLQPDLAADLPTLEEDGRIVVVRLRDGLRFAGGAPVRAVDVKATFELMLDPRAQCATVGPLASGLYDGIEGVSERAAAIAEGGDPGGIVGIEVRDAQTLAFRLQAPDPAFPQALGLPWSFIRPAGTPADPTLGPPDAVGPYRLRRADNGTLTAERAGGWDANVVAGVPESPWENNVEALELEIGLAPATQRARIADGTLDLSLDGSAVAGVPVARLAADPAFTDRVYATATRAVAYGVLRADRAPFGTVDARRAVNLAVDRAAVVAAFGGSRVARPWSQLLPAELLLQQPEAVYARNRAAARVLTAETGLARRRVVIAHSTAAPWPAVARAVARSLRAVGLRVRLRASPPAVFPTVVADRATAWDMAITAWETPYADATGVYVPLLRCDAPGNAGGWCDPAFDATVRDIATLPLGPERTAQFAAVSTSTAEREAPWLVLAQPRRVDVVSARVGNFRWAPPKGTYLALAFVRS